MKSKVFLGGTCANSTWREELIPLLIINYFNPVVEDWNESCQVEEEQQKEHNCDIHLYVITSEMIGVFSIAEVIESVMTKEKFTFLHIFPEGFSKEQLKSLEAVGNMVNKYNGVAYFSDDIKVTSNLLNAN